jgi:hypothetical protein
MTLATMTNNVMRFAPGLGPDFIKSNLQDSYRLLMSRDWNRLNIIRQLTTTAGYCVGTVSVNTGGTVTGVGTTFATGMVGRFFQIGNSFYQIATVTPTTSLTLTDYSGEVFPAGTHYNIFKSIYSVDATLGSIYKLVHQIQLTKKSQSFFNEIDPARTGTGSTPYYWAYAGVTSAGVLQVELYPTPSSAYTVRIYGKLKYTTLADSDVPFLPEDLLETDCLVDCYKHLDIREPQRGWDKKMAVAEASYKESLSIFEEEDYQLGDPPGRVRDVMGDPIAPYDDNFALSHDI